MRRSPPRLGRVGPVADLAGLRFGSPVRVIVEPAGFRERDVVDEVAVPCALRRHVAEREPGDRPPSGHGHGSRVPPHWPVWSGPPCPRVSGWTPWWRSCRRIRQPCRRSRWRSRGSWLPGSRGRSADEHLHAVRWLAFRLACLRLTTCTARRCRIRCRCPGRWPIRPGRP